MKQVRFVLTWLAAILLICIASAYWLPTSFFSNNVELKDAEGAKQAISLLKDWTTWMASIQTATIAALGFLAKDGLSTFKPSTLVVRLGLLVSLFNTVALFFSAWLLTALPSVMLRLSSVTVGKYDFFNYSLYAYMDKHDSLKVFTLAFFAFWNHWLWAIAIVLFGTLSMVVFIARSEASHLAASPS
jgi:hypothetical protein